jgi:hypothetical protein
MKFQDSLLFKLLGIYYYTLTIIIITMALMSCGAGQQCPSYL